MIALGIDLGGTKAEAQIFDAAWGCVDKRRIPTPDTYDSLVLDLCDFVAWADNIAGAPLPVGIGAAGRVNPATGHVLAANICATGHSLPADLARELGREITYLNDSAALTLSEAVLGAGRDYATVACLILGTGVGGGIARDGRIVGGATGMGGEFGHIAAPAHLVEKHALPVLPCGCGRIGCAEMYLSGAGLGRIAHAMTGRTLSPPDIACLRETDAAVARVWQLWCAFAAELMHTLTLTVDPDCFVIGGGLSQIAGVRDDLQTALSAVQIGDFPVARVLLAQGGDASGARGAAYAAHRGGA